MKKSFAVATAVVAILGVVSFGGGSLTAAADPADPTEVPDYASLADSATLTTPVIASGKYYDENGAPLAGKLVVLRVWPNEAVLSSLGVDDDVLISTVGKATTASNGAYELKVANVASLKPYASAAGDLDFEIVAPGDTGTTLSSFTKPLASIAKRVKPPAGTVHPVDESDSSVLVTTPGPTTIDLLSDDTSLDGATTDDGTLVEEDETAEPEVQKTALCNNKPKKKWTKPVPGVIVQAFSINDSGTTSVSYKSGGESSLAIGIQGEYGGVEVSNTNTKTIKAENTLTYKAIKGKHKTAFRTTFEYTMFHYSCMYGTNISQVREVDEYRPTGWQGGSETVKLVTVPNARKCTPVEPGGSWTADATKATTIANGIKIKKYIGADLAMTSGYSKTISLKYAWEKKASLCGTQDYPGKKAGIIVLG